MGIPSIETFPAKRLLTPVPSMPEDFFACDYNLNLYRGCNHGCIYCDTRSVCYQIDRFDTIRVKRDCLRQLEGELRSKKRPGVIGLGAASDSYNRAEASVRATRGALELMRRYGFGVGIPTKGTLVVRDIDVLQEIGRAAPARVSFSVTTCHDELSRRIEPGAPLSSQRLRAMELLAKAGIFTGVWLNPMLPFLCDDERDMVTLLEQIADRGGRFCICHFAVTLREGDREYFYQALDSDAYFAGIKRRYIDAFGLDYICPTPDAARLWPVFKATCERLGLLYTFASLNAAAAARVPTQTSLFDAGLTE